MQDEPYSEDSKAIVTDTDFVTDNKIIEVEHNYIRSYPSLVLDISREVKFTISIEGNY